MNNLFHQSIYAIYSMVSIIYFYVKSYFLDSLQLERDDDFVKFVNPCTWRETSALGDPNMRNLKQGEIIQLERKGYYRCDVPFIRPSKPIVLFAIPDGRQQPPANQESCMVSGAHELQDTVRQISGHRWLNYVVIQESCNDQILEVRMCEISVSTFMLSFACLSANC